MYEIEFESVTCVFVQKFRPLEDNVKTWNFYLFSIKFAIFECLEKVANVPLAETVTSHHCLLRDVI